MSQKYSEELKQSIIDFVAAGNSRRATARKFGVSASFVIKLTAKEQVKSDTYQDETPDILASMRTPDADVVDVHYLADLLGVSTRSISDFATRGIVIRDGWNRFLLKESVQSYCEHVRVVAAGRGGEDAQALSLARARLATEQADTLEMRNARERGELLPRADVHVSVTDAFARVRAKLLAMPSKLAPLLYSMSSVAEIRDVTTRAIHDTLAELSSTVVAGASPADDEQPGDAGGSAGLVGGAGAAADVDGQPMGRSGAAA